MNTGGFKQITWQGYPVVVSMTVPDYLVKTDGSRLLVNAKTFTEIENKLSGMQRIEDDRLAQAATELIRLVARGGEDE